MGILFSITYYSPYISGLTLYCQRLAEGLARRGGRCTVLTSLFDKKLPREERINKVWVRRVPCWLRISKGFLMPSWLWASWRQVRRHEVVVINLPQFEGFVVAFWGRILGKKVISIYHCEVCLPGGILNKLVEFLLYLANFFSLLFSEKIVVYTKDYARNCRLLPLFWEKLVFVYPPIERTENKKQKTKNKKQRTKNREQRREEKRGGGVRIGFAGRVAAEKGLEYLIEALRLLRSQISKPPPRRAGFKTQSKRAKIRTAKLIIAGPQPVGEEKYGKKLKGLLRRYKEEIVFSGALLPLGYSGEGTFYSQPPQTMEEFYRSIDLLVLPSVNKTEAFGMVQVEAMLFGVPVVATNLPGVRVPIKKTGMGELVPAKDARALAEAMARVLKERKKYVKPKEKIEKLFNLEKTFAFYENLLKE